ncbi:S8 family serine peptidase [Oceanicoccus sagamiensis]|uniref:Peptidase S8/S53 domain-containing protein n=1 Tax=Oceanicoccus sagamiensis TaxID=716816 RepID=A0A1X9N7Z2_9GAMM|nr:S8 family serine peptidase [Oceanicoccus sagamiensis]ARN73224.1 hypothetical protein BST96_03345 [Oceanicoccus sagamiensis]
MSHIHYVLKSLVILVALQAPTWVHADPGSYFERLQLAPQYEQLKLRTSQEGMVRVIARVKPHQLFTHPDLQMLQGRARLMSAMQQWNIAAQKELADLPLVVYELNQQQLDTLLDSGWIEAVVEDRANRRHLNASRNYIGASSAQTLGYDGDGAAVAILDVGFQVDHSHFSGRVVEEACFSSSSGSRYTSLCPGGQDGSGAGTAEVCGDGDCYHGTHVASIAAGSHGTYRGVAPKADIIMVQVFTRANYSSNCSPLAAPCLLAFDSDVLAGMAYVEGLASSYNIAAVNLSLGSGEYSSECTSSAERNLANQVADLKALGIATIASSGNSEFTNAIARPACIPDVISVGSVRDTGNSVSTFSNSAAFLDFMAPGETIVAAVPTWIFSNGLGGLSGTSMAAPHVSGAYTVLKAIDSSLTVDQITALLKQQATTFTDPRNGLSFPSLRLNTDNDGDGLSFLTELDNGTDPEDAAPTVAISAPSTGLDQLQTLAVNLQGTATDAEEGNLSSSLQWFSSIDGSLGQGSDISVYLSAGSHTITATVSDSQGGSPVLVPSVMVHISPDADDDGMDDNWEAQYGLTDPAADADGDGYSNLQEYQAGFNPTDAAPLASIDAPTTGADFLQATDIGFVGSATDAEDNNAELTASLIWSSNIDGAFGVGSPLTAALSVGSHTITLSVVDSEGAIPVNPPTIQLTVLADVEANGMADIWEAFYGVSDPLADPDGDGVNNLAEYQQGTNPLDAPATITLLAPANSASPHTDGLAIDFLASAIDDNDGDISAVIAWDSDLDGPLGTGSSLSKVLSVGDHTVTLTATDSEGGVAQLVFMLSVVERGDIDGDGSWTSLDVSLLKDHVFGIALLDESLVSRADIAPEVADGELTAADLYALEVLAFGSQQSPADTDLDLLPDSWEASYGLNPNDAADGNDFNSDADTLSNAQEYYYQTSPLLSDSDGDSFNDSDEVAAGFDPLNATVYLNAPELCGDGVDQNGDGLEIGYEDPADPLSNIVCEEVAGVVNYYVYDYSYQTEGQLLFTVDGSGDVTETRYRHDTENLGEIASYFIYHDNIFAELSLWKAVSLTSAPSASDIHQFLIDRNRTESRMHVQLLANGSANYPLDNDQWSGSAHWAVAHESDERRLQGFIIGAVDTPSLRQRFSIANFADVSASGNLQLQISGSDYSHAGHVDMRSRWVVRYYNEAGGLVGSTFVKSYVMDNSWQDRSFLVDVPVGAVEVQVELQMTLIALSKGQSRNAIYNEDVPVYFDNIVVSAVRRNTKSAIADEALRDKVVLYNYSGGTPLQEPHYFLYNDADQQTFQIDDIGLVSETVYDLQGRVSQRLVYSQSVLAALEGWLSFPGHESKELTATDIRAFLGDNPGISSQLDYHYSHTASIGQTRVIDFSEIVNASVGTSVEFEAVVNVVDGSVVLDSQAKTITFTPSGHTGNESFDLILADGAETLTITLDFE